MTALVQSAPAGSAAPMTGERRATLSVVVPTYYNEGSLPHLFELLSWLEGELDQRGMDLELIMVDDGSGDNSYAELLKIREQRPATKVIKLTRNFGAVAASKTGIRHATGDCLTLLAADLQDPPTKILEMVDQWRAGAKFVICVREKREDSWHVKLFAGLYYKVLSLVAMRDYPRTGYDLMLLDKALIPYVASSSKNVNTHLYAYWLGFEPTVLTYDRPARAHGKSRWTFMKRLKLMVDSVTGFSVVPLRIMSGFGLAAAALSFFYGLGIIIGALTGTIEVPGFATIVALITFFSGLIMLMLGIIGEYLWRIFDNVTSRPESVIERIDQ